MNAKRLRDLADEIELLQAKYDDKAKELEDLKMARDHLVNLLKTCGEETIFESHTFSNVALDDAPLFSLIEAYVFIQLGEQQANKLKSQLVGKYEIQN